jgi:soluble lytic murein transglycosylase-like protein
VRYAGRGGTRNVSIMREHPAKGRVAQMVRRLAPEYRLNPNLVLAVIEAESNFNARARSPKNAQGLMQLIPETAERFGVRNVWDPEQNIRGGMSYLSWLMRHFDGDLELVLAAYNAGEGAVERHGGIPPYAETQNYVRRIVSRLN